LPSDYRNRPDLVRGLRNNNPTNIVPVYGGWQGQVGDDGTFAIFRDMSWGVRAWLSNFYSSYNTHGTTTLSQYITRFAPPSENDTASYINEVATYAGIDPNAPMPLDQATVTNILRGQLNVELGESNSSMVTDDDIAAGFALLDNKLSSFFSASAIKVSSLMQQYPLEVYGTAGMLLIGGGLLIYLIKRRKK